MENGIDSVKTNAPDAAIAETALSIGNFLDLSYKVILGTLRTLCSGETYA